ncbi:MAG: DsbA family protein [Deltaproteobacteria bacterium]|nr:DsbA family protein [Deltaproteobacteria bacterium]
MFKKLLVPVAIIGALAACQPPAGGGSKELVERIEKLEKKVEALEKRPAASAAPAREAPPPQTEAYKISGGDSPVLGSKSSKIELIVFSDYQCPFCSRIDPMLHDVVKDPELKDKVKVVFKQFPLSFHKDAKPAGKAALAARDVGGDKAFWDMSAKMYANQRALTAENFSVWAKEIDINVGKFEKALKDNDAKYEDVIKAESEMGAKEAKVRGTPSLFVNGWELRQRSVDGVKQLIKEKKLDG